MNRSRKIWLAVLYAATLLAAIVVWVILYGRGVAFHFAGVYITPGIFSAAAMVFDLPNIVVAQAAARRVRNLPQAQNDQFGKGLSSEQVVERNLWIP